MNRRRFAFWVGMGLFWLARKTRAQTIDNFAAKLMAATETKSILSRPITKERWKQVENKKWIWFERTTLKNGKWVPTGTTTPVHKMTHQRQKRSEKHLDENLVPSNLRFARFKPNEQRRARHGRPPSNWLRSLRADEIRTWLKTIDVPEAGVSGMTFWVHLTRDHSFDPDRIRGLAEPEQAKLHAAAHFGY